MPTLFLIETASPPSEPNAQSLQPAPHLVVVEDTLEAPDHAITYQIIQTARDLTEQAQSAADEDLQHGTGRVATFLKNYAEPESSLSEIPASVEALQSKIQNANLEQARRVAACLRAMHKALLESLVQPCLVLASEGSIQSWNPAFARWLVLSTSPTDTLLSHFAERETVRALLQGQTRLADETAISTSPVAPLTVSGPFTFRSPSGCVHAEQITMVPLCRIPGCLESVILLFPPVSP